MADGIVSELNELLALKRYAQKPSDKSEGKALMVGNYHSSLRGRGMDFAEARNYQAGDEIRHMEWRVTARTGRPHVKIYQEERERPVVIVCDFNPSMYFGTRLAFKTVVAARLAALLAWTAIKQGDRVGGFLYAARKHDEFTPRGRETAILPFLASLSRYTKEEAANNGSEARSFSDVLIRLQRVLRPGSLIVLISDFYQMDEESERHLSRLRQNNDLLAYQICDPLELAPPKPQPYAISNGNEEMLLDTRVAEVSAAYQAYCEQRLAFLQTQFKRLRIQFLQLTAETDLPGLVRQTFPGRLHG